MRGKPTLAQISAIIAHMLLYRLFITHPSERASHLHPFLLYFWCFRRLFERLSLSDSTTAKSILFRQYIEFFAIKSIPIQEDLFFSFCWP
jgi:hypothetical protein